MGVSAQAIYKYKREIENKSKGDSRKVKRGDAKEQFEEMYASDTEINRTMASELLEVSRRTVQRWINKIENK